ncbi:hypothetical protein ALP36_01732 [Pseudomonas syringae pv. coriandricola]|uniref:Uncharacterized protein n=2 Tax=Pseudomonas syringae group genomosp. 3 TaxID=251701 RepID=A0A3M5RI45_9PSED|nr:polymorphic toxin type 24 domain-containing protein [Pseudomonas syringae group genomosp. 3]RMR34424.1 hypothetical protein ALP87_04121 [Pseudomonas syringae pv. coriandricola]RMU08478.1 hypothetical protein ALP36_01732 [Pseudomonas syringae pv. coriandricola]
MGVYDTRGNYSPTPRVCQPKESGKPRPVPPAAEYSWENPPPRTFHDAESQARCLIGIRFLWSNGERLVGCSWGMTQADGKVIQGELDSKSFLSQVIAGREHKVQLHPWFEPKKQPDASRIALKRVLSEILDVERLEADRLKTIQEQRSGAANAFYAGAALGKGFLYGAWGLVKSVAEFSDLINPFDALSNAAVSAWSAEVLPGGSWLDSFIEQYSAAQHRELAEALGFDPATISREKMAHAYEVASYVFQDNESQLALGHFAREYVKIQNHESILHFTGGMVFEIVLAALLVYLTGGVGLAARVTAASTRLTPLLKRLGEVLEKLGRDLKIARVHAEGHAEGVGSGSQTVVITRAKGVVPEPVAAPPKKKKSRNKPPPPLDEAQGRSHTIVEKPGREGQYTTHYEDGTFKQYRGSGKPHGTFERPNVKYNQLENRGNGIIRPGGADVRYPTPDEIPK